MAFHYEKRFKRLTQQSLPCNSQILIRSNVRVICRVLLQSGVDEDFDVINDTRHS